MRRLYGATSTEILLPMPLYYHRSNSYDPIYYWKGGSWRKMEISLLRGRPSAIQDSYSREGHPNTLNLNTQISAAIAKLQQDLNTARSKQTSSTGSSDAQPRLASTGNRGRPPLPQFQFPPPPPVRDEKSEELEVNPFKRDMNRVEPFLQALVKKVAAYADRFVADEFRFGHFPGLREGKTTSSHIKTDEDTGTSLYSPLINTARRNDFFGVFCARFLRVMGMRHHGGKFHPTALGNVSTNSLNSQSPTGHLDKSGNDLHFNPFTDRLAPQDSARHIAVIPPRGLMPRLKYSCRSTALLSDGPASSNVARITRYIARQEKEAGKKTERCIFNGRSQCSPVKAREARKASSTRSAAIATGHDPASIWRRCPHVSRPPGTPKVPEETRTRRLTDSHTYPWPASLYQIDSTIPQTAKYHQLFHYHPALKTACMIHDGMNSTPKAHTSPRLSSAALKDIQLAIDEDHAPFSFVDTEYAYSQDLPLEYLKCHSEHMNDDLMNPIIGRLLLLQLYDAKNAWKDNVLILNSEISATIFTPLFFDGNQRRTQTLDSNARLRRTPHNRSPDMKKELADPPISYTALAWLSQLCNTTAYEFDYPSQDIEQENDTRLRNPLSRLHFHFRDTTFLCYKVILNVALFFIQVGLACEDSQRSTYADLAEDALEIVALALLYACSPSTLTRGSFVCCSLAHTRTSTAKRDFAASFQICREVHQISLQKALPSCSASANALSTKRCSSCWTWLMHRLSQRTVLFHHIPGGTMFELDHELLCILEFVPRYQNLFHIQGAPFVPFQENPCSHSVLLANREMARESNFLPESASSRRARPYTDGEDSVTVAATVDEAVPTLSALLRTMLSTAKYLQHLLLCLTGEWPERTGSDRLQCRENQP
ncbi:uncharacterized protein MYCFIDRAFT_179673 [Pseudocercospora fijiensis CIRAD86]|uniref:Uncharacterized protein n=1 Tax=Pseudocercospora fijiensis (strain CIRAD86) TaxID=383855 RepID=M2ZZ85_PSEFD|nr:uncharacterized protein MYCFIDRAFT_179673 [Pseudocercospora fijiensis CIRAD86]EME77471.1 hypothetical protein MYCFIDRAFT_179673 [Pseudocercospora fijiensis CIRAD86]